MGLKIITTQKGEKIFIDAESGFRIKSKEDVLEPNSDTGKIEIICPECGTILYDSWKSRCPKCLRILVSPKYSQSVKDKYVAYHKKNLHIGLGITFLGIIISVLGYYAARSNHSGGRYAIFWGLVLVGVYRIIKSLYYLSRD